LSKKTRNRSRAAREPLRHKILLHTGDLKTVGASQWDHHLKVGNLTREAESEHHRELLRCDPLIALVGRGLIAFEDESSGELKFEQEKNLRVPQRLPDGPPVSAQSTWTLVEQEFLLRDTLTTSEVRELTLALKPCVQIPEFFDQASRLVDPGVTLYR
jgi:hypothetical protein